MKLYRTITIFLLAVISSSAFSQTDDVAEKQINSSLYETENTIVVPADTIIKKETKKDSPTVSPKPKIKHDPRIATRRSLIFPGLGQIYNKEYWKLPLVYGALSIPTVTFFYNNTWYKRTKTAYELKYAVEQPSANNQDTLNLQNIHPELKNLSTGSLQSYRNLFRRNRDYSILWFLIVWGLNVADATVFGHLKAFDVSDNLAMQVKPSINPLTKSNELKLTFKFKQPTQRIIAVK